MGYSGQVSSRIKEDGLLSLLMPVWCLNWYPKHVLLCFLNANENIWKEYCFPQVV